MRVLFFVLVSLFFISPVFAGVNYVNTLGSNQSLGNNGLLFLDNTNAKVGVGTTTPVNKLNVVGDLNVTSSAILGGLYVPGSTQLGITPLSFTHSVAGDQFVSVRLPVASGDLSVVLSGGTYIAGGGNGVFYYAIDIPASYYVYGGDTSRKPVVRGYYRPNYNGGGGVNSGPRITNVVVRKWFNGIDQAYYTLDFVSKNTGGTPINMWASQFDGRKIDILNTIYNQSGTFTTNTSLLGFPSNFNVTSTVWNLSNIETAVDSQLETGVDGSAVFGGSVGIGTSSPDKDLVIANTVGADVPQIKMTGASGKNLAVLGDGTGAVTPNGLLELYNDNVSAVRLFAVGTLPSYINAGNVGIGTSSPVDRLDVVGGVRISNATFSPPSGGRGLEMSYRSADDAAFITSYDRAGSAYKNLTLAGSSLIINTKTGGTESMRIDNNGNVGVGTTSPSTLLHLSGASPYIYLDDTSTTGNLKRFGFLNGDVGTTQSLTFQFSNLTGGNVTTVMTVNENGNVGVGTSTPGAPLHVHKAVAGSGDYGNASGGIVFTRYVSGNDYRGSSIFHSYLDNGGDKEYLAFAVASGNTGSPYDKNKVKMVISESGNVGIGTASPGAKLDLLNSFDSYTTYLKLGFNNPSWNLAATFNNFRFINSLVINPADGNPKTFQVGAGGVAIGYANTPTYGSSDALYINGNVGIGTSSPASRLTVVPITYDTTALAVTDYTTPSNIAIAAKVTGDQHGGYLDFYSNYLGYSTPSIEINGRVSSYTYFNAGNVGIGTSSPATLLDVAGGSIPVIRVGGSGSGTLRLAVGGSYYFDLSAATGLGSNDLALYNNGTGKFPFVVKANDNILLVAGGAYGNGSVGIGTNTPTEKLNVVGGNVRVESGNVTFGSSGTGIKLSRASFGPADSMVSRYDGVKAYIDIGSVSNWDGVTLANGGGNVGIGTSTPVTMLEIRGTAPVIKLNYSTSNRASFWGHDSGGPYIKIGDSSDQFDFRNNNSVSIMTITNAGNVGVGTSSPGAKLEVNGDMWVRGGTVFKGLVERRIFNGSLDAGANVTIINVSSYQFGGGMLMAYANDANMACSGIAQFSYYRHNAIGYATVNNIASSCDQGWTPGVSGPTFSVINSGSTSVAIVMKNNGAVSTIFDVYVFGEGGALPSDR